MTVFRPQSPLTTPRPPQSGRCHPVYAGMSGDGAIDERARAGDLEQPTERETDGI